MSEVRYMISDAADKLNIESHVLRYWEEELQLEVPRNEMGHRYYTEEWMKTFERIQMLKNKGYQLRAIKLLLHNQENFQGDILLELPTEPSERERDLSLVTPAQMKLEQFQELMSKIVKNALAENNQELSGAVSDQVGDRVVKEMNYLMREREEQEEQRFRKLDEALRSRQKGLTFGNKTIGLKERLAKLKPKKRDGLGARVPLQKHRKKLT